MIESTLTNDWGTTIPAPVREALGLQPNQTLTYELVEGGVVVRPANSKPITMADLAGSVKSDVPYTSKADERDGARAARLHRYL